MALCVYLVSVLSLFTASLQLANYMGKFKYHHMDLYFVLGSLPLAHCISMAAIGIASKNYCLNRPEWLGNIPFAK